MARKFYYNGQLIRTSINHIYKFALLTTYGDCITCSATREGCEKELRRLKNGRRESITNSESKIKALTEGKTRYCAKDGRHSYYNNLPIKAEDRAKAIEEAKGWIEIDKKALASYDKYQIIELEER